MPDSRKAQKRARSVRNLPHRSRDAFGVTAHERRAFSRWKLRAKLVNR